MRPNRHADAITCRDGLAERNTPPPDDHFCQIVQIVSRRNRLPPRANRHRPPAIADEPIPNLAIVGKDLHQGWKVVHPIKIPPVPAQWLALKRPSGVHRRTTGGAFDRANIQCSNDWPPVEPSDQSRYVWQITPPPVGAEKHSLNHVQVLHRRSVVLVQTTCFCKPTCGYRA